MNPPQGSLTVAQAIARLPDDAMLEIGLCDELGVIGHIVQVPRAEVLRDLNRWVVVPAGQKFVDQGFGLAYLVQATVGQRQLTSFVFVRTDPPPSAAPDAPSKESE